VGVLAVQLRLVFFAYDPVSQCQSPYLPAALDGVRLRRLARRPRLAAYNLVHGRLLGNVAAVPRRPFRGACPRPLITLNLGWAD
jgi:hypothetical protein